MSDSNNLSNFSGVARLFPLPNVVFFPHVVQGLHIFETRYRQLMTDALADDRLIALVLPKSGGEEADATLPPIESVACLGRVSWYDQLPDGRFNLRLRGVSRVRILEEIPTDRLYRSARVKLMADRTNASPKEVKALRRELSQEVIPRFAEDGEAREQLKDLFSGEMPLGQVCDVLAYALPLPQEIKQTLLGEPRADRRAVAMIDALRTSAARAKRKFPPEFSIN
jgi:Lon protease-like protein